MNARFHSRVMPIHFIDTGKRLGFLIFRIASNKKSHALKSFSVRLWPYPSPSHQECRKYFTCNSVVIRAILGYTFPGHFFIDFFCVMAPSDVAASGAISSITFFILPFSIILFSALTLAIKKKTTRNAPLTAFLVAIILDCGNK